MTNNEATQEEKDKVIDDALFSLQCIHETLIRQIAKLRAAGYPKEFQPCRTMGTEDTLQAEMIALAEAEEQVGAMRLHLEERTRKEHRYGWPQEPKE